MNEREIPEGRIGCTNPRCRRTAPAAKYDGDGIICRKCWNSLPPRIRGEHKRLDQLNRKLGRMSRKPKFGDGRQQQWTRILEIYERRAATLESAIDCFFADDEKPAGMEAFLTEIGM